MSLLIPIGTVLTLAGVALLLWCIVLVRRARAEKLAPDAFRARLQRVVAWNAGALCLSALGLMMVVLGILLG